MRRTHEGSQQKTNALLWTIQGLLALVFLFAGGMKLILPIAAMTQQTPLPGTFLRLVGVLEILGALGLVLPGLTRIRPELTPLAAVGLVMIMSGAVGATLISGPASGVIVPIVVGVLLAVVAHGRSRVAPHGTRSVMRLMHRAAA